MAQPYLPQVIPTSDNGSIFFSDDALTLMSTEILKMLDVTVERLVHSYPEYSWYLEREFIPSGYRIRWVK